MLSFKALAVVLLAVPAAVLAQASAAGLTCTQSPLSETPADAAYAAGDFAQAEALFATQTATTAVASNFHGLVQSQIQLNKVAEALVTVQRAVAALPTSADAQAILGDALTRAGQIPEASQAYLRALSLDRCSAPAHLGTARLNELTGHHLSAAREFTFAHKLAPANPQMTAAWLAVVPAAQRGALLHQFLGQKPALPPAQLAQLADDAAILDQHVTCTTESPVGNVRLALNPIFQTGHDIRSWGLSTHINDGPTSIFEVDTTVDGIVLSATDAAKAHVRPLTTVPASSKESYKAVAGELHLGTITYRSCLVTVVPNNMVDNRNSLIGTSFFRDHVLHLDYVARTLTLTALPVPPTGEALTDAYVTPEEKNWTPAYISAGKILFPTMMNKKGPYLFGLNTGAGISILSPAVAKNDLGAGPDRTLNLTGYSGAILKVIPQDGGGDQSRANVYGPKGALLSITNPHKLPEYVLDSNKMADDGAWAFDISPLSQEAGTEISGLLGFTFLSYYSLELNYRDNLVKITYDINRGYHDPGRTVVY